MTNKQLFNDEINPNFQSSFNMLGIDICKFIRHWSLVIGILFISASLSFAAAYDGTWFLGFNTTKAPFNSLVFRKAAAVAIYKGNPSLPGCFIPPGMEGYDESLVPYGKNSDEASIVLRMPKNRKITLMHTDGKQTIEIANNIKASLNKIGFKVELIKYSYMNDEAKWNKALASKKYSLFLMGFKANLEALFSENPSTLEAGSIALVEPLFETGGKANFTGYANPAIDRLIKERKFKEISWIIREELPVFPIFYIEKL